jgi:N-methylhydantoinase A
VSSRTILAVDVGGTFTDAVVNSPGGVFTAKTPTTPHDQSEGVIEAAGLALVAAGLRPGDVDSFIHGMTVTTNALLEGNFAPTALLTTAGFTDLEEIGRQNRAELYRLERARPPAIVPVELRFGLPERCGPDGVITALEDEAAETAVRGAVAAGAKAIAVCLLFSFRHPEHELIVRRAAERVAPELHVSLSHEVVGTFREYERLATTVLDAALGPLMSGYLARLSERCERLGLPEPQVMLSNGGTVPARIAGTNASWTVLSGPAGGAVGAARCAQRARADKGLAFDMGGTSTDISLADEGSVALSSAREIAGRPVALPAVDIKTVGAGGGSIAWRDSGGALRVGPRSAGARPGPACYGFGGREATVTDANLLLGHLAAGSQLAGGLKLDADAAEGALARLGESLGLDAHATALGVIEIANLEMLRATTAATVARGIDPRERALIAFGGAGPMHAAAIAEALEIETVICPDVCGVLSAWGMSTSGIRRDRSRSIVRPLAEITPDELAGIEQELAGAAAEELGGVADRRAGVATYELRYRGQAFELGVTAAHGQLGEQFHRAHEERFGFARPNEIVELVTVRVSVGAPGTNFAGSSARTAPSTASRTQTAWFDGLPHETTVLRGPPLAATAGPLLIELPEATIVVPPRWQAHSRGPDIVLTREARR